MAQEHPYDYEAYERSIGGTLHQIDYEDVAISTQALGLIAKAAHAVMRDAMPAVDPEGITANQAVALFIDHVFWEEDSGGLVMCMDVDQRSYCLPIPSEHWSLKRQDAPLQ